MKPKYKFTKKYDFWKTDHHTNFAFVKWYFGTDYDPCRTDPESPPYLTFLEIGVFEARTSVFLLDNVLNVQYPDRPQGELHCIEPEITKNGKFNLSQHDNCYLYNKTSLATLIDFIQKRGMKFDFIYVDGDHNACGLLDDLILSWKLLKLNGIMLIDDYEMETLDPWFYVSHREFKNTPRLRFTHPRIAIDAFRNIYRGQYDMVVDNYQIGLRKTVIFP